MYLCIKADSGAYLADIESNHDDAAPMIFTDPVRAEMFIERWRERSNPPREENLTIVPIAIGTFGGLETPHGPE